MSDLHTEHVIRCIANYILKSASGFYRYQAYGLKLRP